MKKKSTPGGLGGCVAGAIMGVDEFAFWSGGTGLAIIAGLDPTGFYASITAGYFVCGGATYLVFGGLSTGKSQQR